VLAAGRRAALRWADLITASDVLELYQQPEQPELDTIGYYPFWSRPRRARSTRHLRPSSPRA
jgi:hypothetical protein